MSELDNIQAMWQSQSIPIRPSQALSPPMFDQFQEQMKHFERENAPRYFLFFSIISGLLSLLMFFQAWRQPGNGSLWLGLILFLGTLSSGTQYWLGRKAPFPDADLEAYLRHTRRRLRWRRGLMQGTTVGAGFIIATMIWQEGFLETEIDSRQAVGVGATILIFAGLMGVALWWQHHYGPYSVQEMEQMIDDMWEDLHNHPLD